MKFVNILQELSGKPTMVISGHHGKLHMEGLRFIIDECGGLEEFPISAVVFPSRRIIRDTEEIAVQG